MRYLSICSGVEAATLAWEPLGWKAIGFAEIAPFPSAVLAHRFPSIPNHGDFRQLIDAPPDCDLLVGGTPCQSFSLAGKRRSLDDERGNLTLQYVRLLDAMRSVRWFVWENVPGVLSTKDNAFGCLLGGLVGADAPLRSPLEQGRWPGAGMVCGPRARVAWRVLDAQYFGVPQQRRRVFIVGNRRNGCPASVLFEPKGREWNPTPLQGEESQDSSIVGGGAAGGRVAGAMKAKWSGDECYNLVAFDLRGRDGGAQFEGPHATANVRAAHGGSSRSYLVGNVFVRRLTPLECERLQGMPEDWTKIPWRGKLALHCPDGLRYHAIGNSMAVPVMQWIGRRIALVDGREEGNGA